MSASINAAIHAAACTHSLIEIAPSPVLFLKAVKNETEIEGVHRAMKRDGIAMVKFLRWLKTAVSTGNETEISIDKKLYEFRAGQDYFNGISFDMTKIRSMSMIDTATAESVQRTKSVFIP